MSRHLLYSLKPTALSDAADLQTTFWEALIWRKEQKEKRSGSENQEMQTLQLQVKMEKPAKDSEEEKDMGEH